MKNKTRIARPARPVITTRSEAEHMAADCAARINSRKALEVQMDNELAAIKDRYKEAIGEANEAIDRMSADLQQWAESHSAEFGKRRSLDLVHAVIGFRIHPPKLKPLAKWTWQKVKDALCSQEWGAAYLRVKEDVDKDNILRDISSGTLSPDELSAIGVRVVQEEQFFVNPKLTDAELNQKGPAK